jgi:hypothetical protein
MVKYMLKLPDLILFLANEVPDVHIFICGLTRGTLSDERVLVLILLIMTSDLLKMVSNWTVVTTLVMELPNPSQFKIVFCFSPSAFTGGGRRVDDFAEGRQCCLFWTKM